MPDSSVIDLLPQVPDWDLSKDGILGMRRGDALVDAGLHLWILLADPDPKDGECGGFAKLHLRDETGGRDLEVAAVHEEGRIAFVDVEGPNMVCDLAEGVKIRRFMPETMSPASTG